MKILTAVVVIATVSMTADAQRGMRWGHDSSAVYRKGREINAERGNISRNDSAFFKGRFYRHGNVYAWNGYRGGWRSPGFGPGGRYFGPGPWQIPGPGFAPGMPDFRGYNRIRPVPRPGPEYRNAPGIERIPNLNENQKKDLESLRRKQQEEMKKFREENQKKAESLRKEHMENIRKILTPEQQKWLDEHQKPAGRKI